MATETSHETPATRRGAAAGAPPAEWWKLTPRFWLFAGALLMIFLAGMSVWNLQFNEGLGVTGMNTTAYWGLYVVNFIFLIGLSAGGVIIAAAVHLWNAERYRPVARIAEVLAIVCLLMAMLFIMIDLGRPDRFLNLLLYAHPSSPLIWDFAIIAVYLFIALFFLFFSVGPELKRMANLPVGPLRKFAYDFAAGWISRLTPDRNRKILKYFAMAALPGAVLLHSITAWLLGLIKAHPDWHTAILAPLFIVSAILSGTALLLVTAILSRRFLRVSIPDSTITDLGKLVGWLIPVEFYFSFAELLTNTYGAEPAHVEGFNLMTGGAYAPFFWGFMIVGLLIPFVLLVNPRTRTVKIVGIAALLVVVGVFAKRILILLPPLMHRFLPYPPGTYFPTWVEFTLMASVWAFGALCFVAIAKLIPLGEESHKPATQPYTPPEKQA